MLWTLESWKKRDKVLVWFSKGLTADASARLTFSPELSKSMRAELHRCEPLPPPLIISPRACIQVPCVVHVMLLPAGMGFRTHKPHLVLIHL